MVSWKRAGVGLPPSIQKVEPFQSAPLKFTLEPEMWFQGSQSRKLSTRSGSCSGSRLVSFRPSWPPIMEHMAPCVVGTGFGMPVEPEVKRYFATEASFSFAMAAATAGVGAAAQSAPYAITALSPSGSALTVLKAPAGSAARAFRKGASCSANTMAGFTALKQCFSLSKSVDIVE